jgi:hypothetical protein
MTDFSSRRVCCAEMSIDFFLPLSFSSNFQWRLSDRANDAAFGSCPSVREYLTQGHLIHRTILLSLARMLFVVTLSSVSSCRYAAAGRLYTTRINPSLFKQMLEQDSFSMLIIACRLRNHESKINKRQTVPLAFCSLPQGAIEFDVSL